ncbi:MAG: delta-endotoxin CytB [Symploca sp. SIO1C2]|nr:delta-endotoxin CytB [Symploca sp. SIO1C2]
MSSLAEHHVVLLSTEDEATSDLNFKTMYQVPKKYVLQAISMARVFQDAIEPEDLRFNFEKALEIVGNHKNMAVVSTLNQSIVKQSVQVSAMVNEVMELLKNMIGVVLEEGTPTYKKFKGAIEGGFTNLNKDKDSAWIFWSKDTANKTTYTYNILFAIANQSTGAVMVAAPIGLTIEVDVDKEKVLFFTTKDKSNYSVTVQSMNVVEPLTS